MAVEKDLGIREKESKKRETSTKLINKESIGLKGSKFVREENLKDEMVLPKNGAYDRES